MHRQFEEEKQVTENWLVLKIAALSEGAIPKVVGVLRAEEAADDVHPKFKTRPIHIAAQRGISLVFEFLSARCTIRTWL